MIDEPVTWTDTARLHIDLICAARPNFMKVAPLFHALRTESWCAVRIVHTGQHYDQNMSGTFFEDLQLPSPDLHLGVGSGSHAQQTANVMLAYEAACEESPPDLIVVVGDVNSTLACALVGAKARIPVAHLEAGLRSNDRSMPEEINRLVTDSIADILWTPSSDADENLLREGIAAGKITQVGNIMIDSYELMHELIESSAMRKSLGIEGTDYGVVTLHRPSNVDTPETLERIITQLGAIGGKLPLIFPVHPRTLKNLERFGLWPLPVAGGIRVIDPLGYTDFMNLVCGSRVVITDSGGVQEETTYLGIPCLTLRSSTERPITVSEGTNLLVTADKLAHTMNLVFDGHWSKGRRPRLWDGRTAARVVLDIRKRMGVREAGERHNDNEVAAV